MFPCYSGFASRNVSVFYWPIWSYDFVNRFCSPYQKEGGYTYSSPYGCAFFKDKSFVCKPAGTFLQWHRCSAEQKGRHENLSSKMLQIRVEERGNQWEKNRKENSNCTKLPYHQSFLLIRCSETGANSPLKISFEQPVWCGMSC